MKIIKFRLGKTEKVMKFTDKKLAKIYIDRLIMIPDVNLVEVDGVIYKLTEAYNLEEKC